MFNQVIEKISSVGDDLSCESYDEAIKDTIVAIRIAIEQREKLDQIISDLKDLAYSITPTFSFYNSPQYDEIIRSCDKVEAKIWDFIDRLEE